MRRSILLTSFPLMLIPVGIYNILAALLMLSGADSQAAFSFISQVWFHLPMPPPGVRWAVSIGDFLILFGLICLFLEVIKSSGSDDSILVNHAFSTLLFIFCLSEFLLFSPFATSAFFILTIMAMLDVVAGFTITIISARKDIGSGG